MNAKVANNTLSVIIALAVSEMVDGKRVELGKVSVPTPSLKDIGLDYEPEKTLETGELVYADDTAQYIYSALLNKTLTKCRNKLVPKSIELKDGAEFDKTVAELVAPALGGGGNPEATKAVADLKAAFRSFLAEQGLSAQAQSFLNQMAISTKNIEPQAEAIKAKVEARFTQFFETQPAILENGYAMRFFEKLVAACAVDEISLDDL